MTISASCRTLLLALGPALLLANPPKEGEAPAAPVQRDSPGTPAASPLPATPKSPLLRSRGGDPAPVSPLDGNGMDGAGIPEPPEVRGLAHPGRAAAGEALARAGARPLGSGRRFCYENTRASDVFIHIDRDVPEDTSTVYYAPSQAPGAICAVAGHEQGPIRVPAGTTMILAVGKGEMGVWVHVQDARGAWLGTNRLAPGDAVPGQIRILDFMKQAR